MIQVNDEFSFSTDPHNWILHHTYMGVDKNKKPKRQTRETYYPNLEQLCNAMLDKASMEAPSIEGLKETMFKIRSDIRRMLKGIEITKEEVGK